MSGLSIGILVRTDARIALNINQGATKGEKKKKLVKPIISHSSLSPFKSLAFFQQKKNIPLGQAQQKVLARTVHKARHAEPAGLAVLLAPAVARDGVSDVFLGVLLGAADLGLGRIGQVADDGDAGDGARGGGAECAGSSSCGGGGAAEKERRHGGGLKICGLNDIRSAIEKEKEKEKEKKNSSRRGGREKTCKFLSRYLVVLLFGPLPCSLSKSCEEMGHVRTR